jgi:hypothetical protein
VKEPALLWGEGGIFDWRAFLGTLSMNLGLRRIHLTSTYSLLALSILLFPLFLSCTPRQETLKKKLKKNPCLQIDYWGDRWKQTALTERVKEAPQELIEKVHIENEMLGFRERPTPIKPPPEIHSAIESIEESLPSNIISIIEKRFVGIFSVKELGGSGYADVVHDKEGNETYALIILDADLLLKKKANEWATWKLNSTFKPDAKGHTKMRAIIEKEENNNVVNAIRFILLHELGHVLGVLTKSCRYIRTSFSIPISRASMLHKVYGRILPRVLRHMSMS